MGENALLELIIKAKDEATATLNGVGKAVDDTAKKAGDFSKTMKLAGGILTGAGVAGVAMMNSWIEKAMDVETAEAQLSHAVLNVSHATKEQLESTRALADALEAKGVLDGDNIKIGLAQLSTFGLSNKAVQGLGGALADLAVNQFGVSASGDQMSQTANMIAKALKGQFGVLEKSGIRFTEAQQKIIQFGKEEERVKAINEGFAQNLKYTNETARATGEGMKAHLGVQLENIQETLGTKLLPVLAKIIGAISKFADFIGNMNPKVLETVAIVVAIGSAFALVVGPILMLIGFLPALSAGFAILSTTLLPAIGIIAGIIAVATAVYLAFKNWDKIKDFLAGVWESIAQFFTNVWNAVKAFLQPLVDFFVLYLTTLWNIYSYIFTQIFTIVKFVFEGIWALVQIIFYAVQGFIEAVLNKLWEIFGEKLTAIYEFVSTTFGKIWAVISEKFNAVKTVIMEVWGSVHTWFTEKLEGMWTKVSDIAGKIKQKFVDMAEGIKNALSQIKFPHLSIGSGTTTVAGHEISYPKLNVDWYEQGGWVRNTGLAVVHQGEFVMSKDMLAGRKSMPNIVTNRNNPITINLVANTPVDLDMLNYQLAFALRNN